MDDMQNKRAAFEHAYTLSANAESRTNVIKWMRSWERKGGYDNSKLHEAFVGFCLATTTHISIQEAWEMAGGNPGIQATREELESALKALDEVCDEADESISLAEVWDALGGDSTLEKPTLENVRSLLKVTRMANLARKAERQLPMSIGFRGPVPDRNGDVYELPEITPELRASAEKSLREMRGIGDISDMVILVNTSKDPKAPYKVVRTKERVGGDPNLHFEINLDAPLMAPAPEKPAAKRGPKVDAGERMRKQNEVPARAKKNVQTIGAEIRKIRQSLNMNQTEFGELVGLKQTEVSSAERGMVTKRSDGGVSAIDKATALLSRIKGIVAEKSQTNEGEQNG